MTAIVAIESNHPNIPSGFMAPTLAKSMGIDLDSIPYDVEIDGYAVSIRWHDTGDEE